MANVFICQYFYFLYIPILYIFQKGRTAFADISVGGLKISRVPRVGDLAGAAGKLQQLIYFVLRVGTDAVSYTHLDVYKRQVLRVCPWVTILFLRALLLRRNNDRRDHIHHQPGDGAGRQRPQKPYKRRVDIQVLPDAAADTAQHPVIL